MGSSFQRILLQAKTDSKLHHFAFHGTIWLSFKKVHFDITFVRLLGYPADSLNFLRYFSRPSRFSFLNGIYDL